MQQGPEKILTLLTLAGPNYDVTVYENPAYEGIIRLPLNMIYFVVSYWQVTRCSLLKRLHFSGTACYVTVLLI